MNRTAELQQDLISVYLTDLMVASAFMRNKRMPREMLSLINSLIPPGSKNLSEIFGTTWHEVMIKGLFGLVSHFNYQERLPRDGPRSLAQYTI